MPLDIFWSLRTAGLACASRNTIAYSNNLSGIRLYADSLHRPNEPTVATSFRRKAHASPACEIRPIVYRCSRRHTGEHGRQLPMTFPLLLNPLFQMTAAFIIFFAGFITLFSFVVLCVVIAWALYRCTNRLALLISRSHQETSPLISGADSPNPIAGIRHQPVQSRPLPG
jgi:hypothetical protein